MSEHACSTDLLIARIRKVLIESEHAYSKDWASVKNRLPKIGQRVFAIWEDCIGLEQEDMFLFEDNSWWKCWDKITFFANASDDVVIRWRPIGIRQQSLSEDFKKVLDGNLWDLYGS